MALLGPHIRPATSALQRMTIRLSSGTSSRCLGPSRTLFWPTQLKERSTMYSGLQPSLTGSQSAITTAWRFSVCSVGPSPTRQGLVRSSLCPLPSPPKKMFPVASMSVVALHPPCLEAAVGVQASYPLLSVLGCAVWRLRSPRLGFKIFTPFFFFASSIKHFCVFVCQLLCS